MDYIIFTLDFSARVFSEIAPIRRYFEFVCLPCSRHLFQGKKQEPFDSEHSSEEVTQIVREMLNDEELMKQICNTNYNPREDLSDRLKDAMWHWFLSVEIPDFLFTELGEDTMEQTKLVDEYNDELCRRNKERDQQYEFLKRQTKE